MKEINKTLIRWLAGTFIVSVVCITFLILTFKPYEIRFSADTNLRDSIIATSEAIRDQNTITEQPILIDKNEFAKYCIDKNPPSVVSCVIGCYAYRDNEHNHTCGEGVTCRWDNERDCNQFCEEKY